MIQPLSIQSTGLYLPPAVDVREFAAARGADVSNYRSWDKACHACPDDHPSSMGAAALAQAIERAGIARDAIRLVIFSGSSRDYLPSWSVSNEIMNLCGLSSACLGLDITAGCLATLSALDLMQAWLAAHGGQGYAAVVAAERWTQTVNYADASMGGLWSYGDSGGALLATLQPPRPGIADFLGAEFRSNAENNGHVLIQYGGTREPQAPPGIDPHTRMLSPRPGKQITAAYRKGFADAWNGLKQRAPAEPTRMLCNQMSPQMVAMLAEVFGLQERAVITGSATGHLGGTDIIMGLQKMAKSGGVTEPVLVGASTAYGYGTGLLVPPRA